MLRPYLFSAGLFRAPFLLAPIFLGMASAAMAQSLAEAPDNGGNCRVRISAVPTAWIIQGHDPFGSGIPEATFSATFINDGDGDCRFSPTFQLDEPPFGLSKGMGRPIRYAVLNVTDTQDVSPRAGRTQRRVSRAEVSLAPNEVRTVLYKLVADPDDITHSGTFTQNVTLEAEDETFRVLGGTRLVLGINVLPSARIGLSGAFTMNDGHAVVDLGELRQGPAPVPLQLRVSSTGRYEIAVTSANSGRLRLGSSDWLVPYSLAIGGESVNLAATDTITGSPGQAMQRDSLPIEFVIGDVSNRRAGVYSDVVSISVTAR